MDQTPQLAELPDVPRPGAAEDAPPLGPFRTFQTPIRDIAELMGLDLDQLIEVVQRRGGLFHAGARA